MALNCWVESLVLKINYLEVSFNYINTMAIILWQTKLCAPMAQRIMKCATFAYFGRWVKVPDIWKRRRLPSVTAAWQTEQQERCFLLLSVNQLQIEELVYFFNFAYYFKKFEKIKCFVNETWRSMQLQEINKYVKSHCSNINLDNGMFKQNSICSYWLKSKVNKIIELLLLCLTNATNNHLLLLQRATNNNISIYYNAE